MIFEQLKAGIDRILSSGRGASSSNSTGTVRSEAGEEMVIEEVPEEPRKRA